MMGVSHSPRFDLSAEAAEDTENGILLSALSAFGPFLKFICPGICTKQAMAAKFQPANRWRRGAPMPVMVKSFSIELDWPDSHDCG